MTTTPLPAQTEFLKYLREKFPDDKFVSMSFPKGCAPNLTDNIRGDTDLYQETCIGFIFNTTRNEEFYFDEGEDSKDVCKLTHFLMHYSKDRGNFGFSFSKHSSPECVHQKYEDTDIQKLTNVKYESNNIQKLY